ncbi:hypothetical protein [Okeania sp. SIO2B3]|uniref:hypothetical protein n=1 Tax=Okeania sp. SIO2B3 TaxID=2607784 RepID=UPI0013C1B6C0|nr:hypothetical protein [Okeania sp. SIO2B3]NET44846.1 hypothetical protein [Okeania sp. SIO2B3]
MTINSTKSNLLILKRYIKLLKPLSISCGVVAIAGLAIYPLINTKSLEKAEEKVEQNKSILSPAPYTIVIGEKDNEVILRFHNQKSELHLKNITTIEYNCLLNGGGINCVLAQAYQPKSKVVRAEQSQAAKAGVKQQAWKILDIEISKNMMGNIIFVGGVFLGLLLLNQFKK